MHFLACKDTLLLPAYKDTYIGWHGVRSGMGAMTAIRLIAAWMLSKQAVELPSATQWLELADRCGEISLRLDDGLSSLSSFRHDQARPLFEINVPLFIGRSRGL